MKRRRRHKRRQMRITKWFQSLSKKKKIAVIAGGSAGVIVLGLAVAAIIYVANIFGKLDTQEIKEEDIVVNDLADTVGEGYTNVVLFGGDSRSGNVTKALNTDSIIIASLNNETKEVKLISVYRDTLMDVGKGSIKKCNSAYSLGGPAQAINMLNMNLDLDIQKYVTVDFGAVSDLVDLVGGIEVEVSEAERKAVNKYIEETAMVAGKKANKLTKSGLQRLDGVQATTYARIRKGVGDDYARTGRQRLIIQKVFEKVLKSDLSTINKIIDKLFPQISTNFSMTEVLSYAKDVTKYKISDTTGFPFEKGSGTIPGRGSCIFPITLKKNVSLLHKYMYGTEDYQPSSKVVSISGAVAEIVGNRKADPEPTYTPGGTDPTTTPSETPETPGNTPETPGNTPTGPGQQPSTPGNSGGIVNPEDENDDEEQNGDEGDNQGGNQGEDEDDNQGGDQGGDEDDNQGGNQGGDQGGNQGGDQGGNQGGTGTDGTGSQQQ